MERSSVYNTLIILVSLAIGPVSNTLADDLEQLTKQCGMCHGQDGNSPSSTIPSIAGLTLEYFKHTLDAYKNDGRKSELMKSFVHTLNEHQIEEIGLYYQKQKYVARDQKFDASKAAKGKELHNKYCEKCHENEGRITENNYGVLAGQWMPYLTQAIKDYLDGKRKVAPMMITKLKALKQEAGDEGIEQLVNFYASVK
jgi:sulfide dehydrogenase cytochrome subunit